MRSILIPSLLWLAMLCLVTKANTQQAQSSYLSLAVQSAAQPSTKTIAVNLLSTDKGNELNYNMELSQIIKNTAPKYLEFQLNLPDQASVTVQLIKNSSLSDENQGLYYGILSGQGHSIVNLSYESGSIYLDVQDGIQAYRVYPDRANRGKAIISYTKDEKSEGWSCENNESTVIESVSLSEIKSKSLKSNLADTVDVYIEADYAVYTHQGSELAARQYVERVMNRVSSLYFNENIIMKVSDVKIWTTNDPYDYTTSLTALESFVAQRPCNFKGDIAHLISGRDLRLGGVAYVQGVLRREYAAAFSNVHFDEESQPYSWDVNVIAHEIGHNLGSRHTHDCVWGPNENEAIDACYTNSTCNDKSIPQEGGTVMSYCHLTSVGINHSLGFGEQPGNVIRQITALKTSYVGTDIYSAITLSDSIIIVPTINQGYGAQSDDAYHAVWYKYTPEHDAIISINNCGQGVDSRLFVYAGEDCSSIVPIAVSDDDCFSSNGLFYASSIEDLYLFGGETYYFEWDSKWSSAGFTALVTYDILVPTCENGVMDNDETGIDCGGLDCVPCAKEIMCSQEAQLPMVIDKSTECNRNTALDYHGMVIDTADLEMTSPISIELSAGFEIAAGGTLSIEPAACKETEQSSL